MRSSPFSGRPVERPLFPPIPLHCWKKNHTHTNRRKHAQTHTSSQPPPPPPLTASAPYLQCPGSLHVCLCERVCVRARGKTDEVRACVHPCVSQCIVCEGREIGVKYSHQGCLSSPPPPTLPPPPCDCGQRPELGGSRGSSYAGSASHTDEATSEEDLTSSSSWDFAAGRLPG